MIMPGSTAKGNILLLLIAASLSVFAAEAFLRYKGYAPGKHTPVSYFNPVDELESQIGFEADSNGIFSISREGRQAIWSLNNRKELSPELSRIIEFNTALRNGKADGELADTYEKAIGTEPLFISAYQQAVINYVDSGVNAFGFKSIDFRKIDNSKPSVLMLGDSYTFGHSASAYHKSFPDILLARGYTVYNSGITGTDVAQYLAVAKRWIPELRPDVVVVNFYMGNDIAYYRREVGPDRPVFFTTNAGIMMACPDGVQLWNAEEAYDLCMHWVGIPQDRGIFDRVMAGTTITSAIYGILWRNGIVKHRPDFVDLYYSKVKEVKTDYPYSRNELLKIDSIAGANGSRIIISVIPELLSKGFRRAEDVPDAFTGINYAQIDLDEEDCEPRGGHFNDRGHRRYADFLQKLIDEQ